MVEENPRDVGHEMDGISVVYGDESLPHLYENTRISSDQLPGQSGKCTVISSHFHEWLGEVIVILSSFVF